MRDSATEETILSIGWVLHSLMGDGPYRIDQDGDMVRIEYADPITIGNITFFSVCKAPIEERLWDTIQGALDAI